MNVVLCLAEAPEVRAAALHALSDLCHTSDDTAAALADASTCGTLPDAAAWLASTAATGGGGANGQEANAVTAPFFMRVLCALLDGEKAEDDDEDEDDNTAAPVVPQLAAAAAEAGAKLLLAQRLRSGPNGEAASPAECGLLLSRLVALYFRSSAKPEGGVHHKNEASGNDAINNSEIEEAVAAASRAQQVLSVFFPAFAREQGAAAVLQAGLDSFLADYTAAASSAVSAIGGEAMWSPLRGACTVAQAVLFFVALFDSANASPNGLLSVGAKAAATNKGDEEEEAKESDATEAPSSPEAPVPCSSSSSSSSRGSWRLQASLKLSGLLVNHRAWAGPKGSASSTARKQLAKALSTMPVLPSDDENNNHCDVELLKLCGLWGNMAMQAVSQLDGAAAAKPIAKFVAAVRAADPRPEDELPAEFKYDASLEILVANPLFGGAVGAEKLATLLAGSSSNNRAEDAPSSIKSRPRGSHATKRQSLKEESSSSEESDDSDDAADDDDDADVADAENEGPSNSVAVMASTTNKTTKNKEAPDCSKGAQKSAHTEDLDKKQYDRRPLDSKA